MRGHRNSYGYSEYRGRGAGLARTVLLVIIVLLAVLLAAGAAFTIFMGQYLEYTDSGIVVRWPWVQETAPPPPIASDPIGSITDPVVDVTDPVVDVTDPVVDITVVPTPDPEPTPPPEPQYTAIGAVTVTASQLRNGSAAQAVAAAGGTALVVEMKDMYGKLAWQSQAPLAVTLRTNAADNLTAQAVQTLAQTTDLYLVARIQCFRDSVLARNWIGSLISLRGRVWYDMLGMGWTSPVDQQATDYLSALCRELADMGFDEIVLDSAGYPNTGEVHVLATNDNRPEDLTVPVSAFLDRITGEMKERGVAVSVFTNEALDPGGAVNSGVTAGVLAGHADRVWLDSGLSAEQYTALLTAAGWEDPAPRLVVKNASAGAGSWYK